MINFSVYGPFEIPLTSGLKGFYIADDCPDFWKTHPAHKDDFGIYIFAKRAARGFQPLYIGKTVRTFQKESFDSHKIASHYLPAYMNMGKGTLVMFFLVPDVRVPKPTKQIGELEIYLIQTAAIKNPSLSNIHHAGAPEWMVNGVVRSSRTRPTKKQAAVKTMLGLSKPKQKQTRKKSP